MIPSSYKPIEGDSPPASRNNATGGTSDDQNLKWNQNLLRSIQSIDRGFFVSKLFYFFFYTALGALFPFFSLYYKQLWLSPVQTGLLLALRPSVKLICLPLWRMVTDKFSKPKVVYFISMFGWMIGYYGQTFVFPEDMPCYLASVSPTQLTSSSLLKTTPFPMNGSGKLLNMSSRALSDTILDGNMPDLHLKGVESQVVNDKSKSLRYNFENSNRKQEWDSAESILPRSRLGAQAGESQMRTGREQQVFDRKRKQSSVEEYSLSNNAAESQTSRKFRSDEYPVKNERDEKENGQPSMQDTDNASDSNGGVRTAKRSPVSQSPGSRVPTFQASHGRQSPRPADDFRVKYNFWMFRTLLVIVILTEIITTPTPMLADSAVVQAIANTDSEYGNQRLFGSLGLALAAILIAVWASLWTSCNYTDTIDYLPCFYLFEVALGATVIVSLFFKFETPERKKDEMSILEGLKLFTSPRAGFFLFTIFVLGYCHSVQISFLFWFLQDLGGTPTLFGIIILVYCFAEVVMYFISNYVVLALGQQGTLCLALACYTARFLMYGNLKDPWLVIPMEMVQGVTYGGVWSIAVNYVNVPEEASVVVQSILHGAYWGVGMAAGSLVSGIVIQFYGAQAEFLVMSAIIFALCFLHVIIEITDRVREQEEEAHQMRRERLADEPPDKDLKRISIGAAAAPLVPCLLYGR